MTAGIPILMYHEVTPQPRRAFRKYSVTPEELSRHVGWLAREGYTAVSMAAVRDALRGTCDLPPRPVAITFDDGFQDALEHAVPILAARGFTATFYVVAALVGTTSRWLQGERGFELPLAGWPTLRAAIAAGMHCESHTMSHPRLATLTPAACREELSRARDVLEAGLGQRVLHLAYPFGSFSTAVRDAAHDTGYETACTVREAIGSPGDDLLALPRIPVLGGEGMRDFVSRLRTARPARGLGATVGGILRGIRAASSADSPS